MIINNRTDLDDAPAEERERFLARLAAGINKHRWDGTEWVLYQDTATIERYGYTVEDFPDALVPDAPDYNPDQKALDAQAAEIRETRDRLISESDWTVMPDSPVDDPESWKVYRQALRDVPQQDTFPEEVTWPEKPIERSST